VSVGDFWWGFALAQVIHTAFRTFSSFDSKSWNEPTSRGNISLEHQNFEIFFKSTRKMLKTSRITILRLLITNIYSKFRFYTVVVVKWDGRLGSMGCLLGSFKSALRHEGDHMLLMFRTFAKGSLRWTLLSHTPLRTRIVILILPQLLQPCGRHTRS
jgi:hypothetical protein